MSNRPYAAFDIDGTVIRWQLYHAIADELAHRGDIAAKDYRQVKQARLAWKNRKDSNAFAAYEDTLVALVDRSITGLTREAIRQASDSVIKKYRQQVYVYTRNLIKDLKQQNYLLFAISASQSDIVGAIADYYGFDDYGGSVYENVNGRFTGKKDVLYSNAKPEYLMKLIKKHHARTEDSIAIGDSESDIPMLQSVQHPIAFNPTKQLYDYARQHKWRIVIERKNVIYELIAQNTQYILEQ